MAYSPLPVGRDPLSRLKFAARYQPTWNLRYNLIPFFVRCQRDFGDVAKFPFGRHSYIVLSDPQAVDDVLVGDGKNFPRGVPYKVWARQRQKGGYTALGPYSEKDVFMRTRRSLQKTFSPTRSAGLWSFFSDVAEERLLPDAARYHGVDLAEVMRPGAMQMTLDASFGELDVESLQLGRWYRSAHYHLSKKPSRKFKVYDYLRLPTKVKALEASESLASTMARNIAHGELGQETLLDQLHQLVAAGQINHQDAMWQAVSVLMTTNHGNLGAIVWAIWRLVRNPEALANLRAELDRAGEVSGLSDLPYLEAVVNESFRQHPTIVGLTREALAPRSFNGVSVEPGDIVEICPYILSNDPRWWSDAGSFIPERWLDNRDAGRPKQSFIPFGAGMRKCLAYPMVMTMVGATVASLVRKYDFTVVNDPRSRYDSIPRGLIVDIRAR